MEGQMQRSVIHEVLIAWKISSIVFGNVMCAILFLTWWQGESWVRADNGAVVEMSRGMSKSMR